MTPQVTPSLNATEKKIAAFVGAYRKKNGFGPSTQEIAKKFTLNPGSVSWAVNQLLAKGVLKRQYTPDGEPVARSLEVAA